MDVYIDKTCKYCSEKVHILYAESIICNKCDCHVHISCISRGIPGALCGDTFFTFYCKDCAENKEEFFDRKKITWLQACLVVLYHLTKVSFGTSTAGYFHWKTQLAAFMDRRWNNLFAQHVKQKKSWMGTVSGTLSHFRPCFFSSGTKYINSGGWWRLTFPEITPTFLSILYKDLNTNHKITFKNEGDLIHVVNYIKKYFPEININHSFIQCIGEEEPLKMLVESEKKNTEEIDVNKSVIEPYLPQKLELSNLSQILNLEDNIEVNEENTIDILKPDIFPDLGDLEEIDSKDSSQNIIKINVEEKMNLKISNVKPELNYVEKITIFEDSHEDIKKVKNQHVHEEKTVVEKMNFNQFCHLRYKFNKVKKKNNSAVKIMCPMLKSEKMVLLDYLKKNCNEKYENALYRKLKVRLLKEEKNLNILNIDDNQKTKDNYSYAHKNKFCHFYKCMSVDEAAHFRKAEKVIVMGKMENRMPIISPYTGRTLKPFIRREKKSNATWISLMNELMFFVHLKKYNQRFIPSSSTIDYCYMRPDFLPAVHTLCEKHFWPGIDLTDTLTYPDFTVVVLYKRVIIGFAFMVPDSNIDEAYISFMFTRPEWRRIGIAKNMLYHLTQTCWGKDICLHVAVDNPAVFLYQKFGFKVQEILYNFYEAYIRDDNKMSRHAFYLKLARF